MEYYIGVNMHATNNNSEKYRANQYYFKEHIDKLFEPEYCIIREDNTIPQFDEGHLTYLDRDVWKQIDFLLSASGMFEESRLEEYKGVVKSLNDASKAYYSLK